MSADNYIYVDSVGGGRYGVWDNLSASADDPLHGQKALSTHATVEEAIMAAHRLNSSGYYEYGVVVGCELPDAVDQLLDEEAL